MPDMWGKIKPEWVQADEMQKMWSEEDRDIIAVRNLLHRYQMDVGASPVHPESPPMIGGGKG
jgi:uncharacterized protein (UPF0305 family)